ncbi:DUF2125 domain-containing protein [Falsiroseomonas sp. HW251]|uniref:DUF2125 domain-containing protein n=1 Tax=Falsiroseomonas sp. HW251 TaxID=3390998 RepID=UPI003D31439A
MDRKAPRLGRALLVGTLGLLVLLGAGHALLWHAAAGQLEAGWQDWVRLRRGQGWRVEHAPPVTGGWPLAVTLGVDRLRLDGGAATLPGGIALSAEKVVLRVRLPWLDRLLIELPGQQRLRLGDTEFPFVADTLSAVVPLDAGTLPSTAEIAAERLRLGTPAGGVEVRSLRLGAKGSASATEEEPVLSLALTANGVQLPAAPPGRAGQVFGRRMEQVAADLSLSGPMPPARDPVQRAAAWRDGGGTLEVRSLSLQWGPMSATAAATMALDERLQPMGAGTLRLSGAQAALDALAEAGLVAGRPVQMARAVLPLLSRPTADGGSEIEVPLTLDDRMLLLARIPVLRLPPLEWPR